MDKFVIMITGGRKFTNPAPIREKLQEYIKEYGAANIILREGEAQGADTLARLIAQQLRIGEIQQRPVEYYGYNWDKDGNNAGNLRNEAMVDEIPIPNVVLGFPDDSSKGTWNALEYAESKGIKTETYCGALSQDNPHLPTNKTQTSIEKDIEFGISQETIFATMVADQIYPGALLHRLPEYSDLDFAVTKDGELKCFIEVKARRNSVNDYTSTMIAERKHIAARNIYETLKVQTLAVIVFTDALVSFHLENAPDISSHYVQRDDRDKGTYHIYYNHSRFTYHIRKDIFNNDQ